MVVVINKGSTDTEPLVEALDTVIVFGELVIARVPMNDPSNPLSDLTGPEKVVRAILNLRVVAHRHTVSTKSARSVGKAKKS
jgi:hypothetical protein